MARKPRNYAAEYARRLARAAEKGYSKSVARGHAPKGTVGLARAKKLKVPPGFVIFRKKPRKGFVATPESRARNIRKVHVRPSEYDARLADVTTDQDAFIDLLNQAGFTEREAYTLWFS